MSKYITSVALFGAFLVAAPATFADYELFADCTRELGAVYAPGSEVVTFVELTKGGGTTVTNGTVSWNTPNSAWSVQENYLGDPNAYWITCDGTDPNAYADSGFALTGSIGSYSLGGIAAGLMANVSLWGVDGWEVLGSLSNRVGIPENPSTEFQSYLDGVKTNSAAVNEANDAMLTFMFVDWRPAMGLVSGVDFSNVLVESGGFGIRINADTRDMSFAIIAVKEPADVPEPATLVMVGLGLAGLGLARRRRK